MKYLLKSRIPSGISESPVSVVSHTWKRCMSTFLIMIFALIATSTYATPNVVVSIAPLHSLMSEVMRGVGEPVLLIEGGQSPHSSYLAPSARRKIARADLLVWLDASFESSLAKAFSQATPETKVVGILAAPTIRKLPIRANGVWEVGHQHHEADSSDHASDDMPLTITALKSDPHLWLSTQNAIEIVSILASEISQIDPQHAQQYASNRAQIIESIGKLKNTLTLDLRPVADVPYLVFHDAYHYFEDEFGLSPAGAVTLNPERKPGAKTIMAIKSLIVERDVRCLFSEPQFEPGLLRRLAEDEKIKTGVLDPLGSNFPPGIGQWYSLMRAMRDSLLSCLIQADSNIKLTDQDGIPYSGLWFGTIPAV